MRNKYSDLQIFLLILLVTSFHSLNEINNSEVSVNLQILLSNDSLYLYFFRSIIENLISFFYSYNNQFVSPISYFFVYLFHKLSNDFGLFCLNIISHTFCLYLFFKFIDKFYKKEINSISLFLLLINIFCFFEVFYANFFQLTILPRKLFGLIIFFAILIQYFEFLKNNKNIFILLTLYFLLFITNIFLFIFMIVFTIFFFFNFIKSKNLSLIFFYFVIFIIYYFSFLKNIDTSIIGVSYQKIRVLDTIYSTLTRKVFLFNIFISVINFIFIFFEFRKTHFFKIITALIISSIFTPFLIIVSGVNLQNYHFIYYCQLLLAIISLTNLYLIILDKIYLKYLFFLKFNIFNIVLILTLFFNFIFFSKISYTKIVSEYDVLIKKHKSLDIDNSFELINLHDVLTFIEKNKFLLKDNQIVTNFRFLNNYFKHIKNYEVLFDSRISQKDKNQLLNFNYLSDIQYKNKLICKEQLIFNFHSHYKYYISLHHDINLNDLNISNNDLDAYFKHDNVFRKFYYVDYKLLDLNNIYLNYKNKLFIIFKDNVCSNIDPREKFYENKDFMIGKY